MARGRGRGRPAAATAAPWPRRCSMRGVRSCRALYAADRERTLNAAAPLRRRGGVGGAQALDRAVQDAADLHLRHAHPPGDLALREVAGVVEVDHVALERLEQRGQLAQPRPIEGAAQALVL